jgi:hypothetical protein
MDSPSNHRGVIKREHVRVEERPAGVRPARPAEASCPSSPRVRLTALEGGRHVIELTCSCGEVSLIEIQSEKKP